MKAVVSNVERLATYDGPGLRTVIYFKGCPLRCVWCSNPETQHLKKQIMVNHQNCINCKNCIKVCQKEAITYNQKVIVDFNKCTLCGKCIRECPSGSLVINGKDYSLSELRELVNKDKVYYDKSNGGLTVSGGEMLMQGEFIVELFKVMRKDKINTAFETSGYGNHELFKKIVSYTDYLIFDYKLPTELMLKYTQKSNELIRKNLQYALTQKDVLVRVPIIPGINTDVSVIEKIINELVELGVNQVELLKYHRFGLAKYDALNMKYSIDKDTLLLDEQFERVKELFRERIEIIK